MAASGGSEHANSFIVPLTDCKGTFHRKYLKTLEEAKDFHTRAEGRTLPPPGQEDPESPYRTKRKKRAASRERVVLSVAQATGTRTTEASIEWICNGVCQNPPARAATRLSPQGSRNGSGTGIVPVGLHVSTKFVDATAVAVFAWAEHCAEPPIRIIGNVCRNCHEVCFGRRSMKEKR